LASLQNQQNSFNVGQEARFARINRRAASTRRRAVAANRRALKAAKKIGRAQKREIGRQAVKSKAGSTQSLTSRGLGNTTIVEQQSRAIDEDANRARAEVDEQIAGRQMAIHSQRAGLEESLGRFGVDTLLSRRDQAPNISQTLQLLARLGGGV
jgi:hypothetical protein